MNTSESIKQKALELGFDLVGITTAEPIEQAQLEYLQNWLKNRSAAGMQYMYRNLEKRINPAEHLKNAKSIICTGLNYRPQNQDPKPPTPAGKIANFALCEDYHQFIKNRLEILADFIRLNINPSAESKICVDSAPLAERALAARAGLGFIGKNRMLINPDLGSQILLGEIITTIELDPDNPIEQKCPNCNRCLAACPTGALDPDGNFDSNKCISYLTIEHKHAIEPTLAEKINYRLFGCDECILACPFETGAPSCKNADFKKSAPQWLNLQEILAWNENQFDGKFNSSTIKRLGLQNLKRNAKICLNNNANPNHGTRNVSSGLPGNSEPR